MMNLLSPIRTESLVSVFVSRFEELILSGQLGIGQRLPSERELAQRLGVSRPVVHEGLVELQAKGLVSLMARKGAYVNDYRQVGSLPILESLIAYKNGALEPGLFESLLEMRTLFELETVRLAAKKRTEEHLRRFDAIIDEEQRCAETDPSRITGLDFELHHLIAIASGNLIYPLIMNSFRPVYTNLTGKFFTNTGVIPEVINFHRELVGALAARDVHESERIMKALLDHGVRFLKRAIAAEKNRKTQRAV